MTGLAARVLDAVRARLGRRGRGKQPSRPEGASTPRYEDGGRRAA
jgi:hypothetical protein